MADNKTKILIIEDEALVAREIKSRLTNMGYEVVGVAYGREGIDLARETLPDLLLTDIHLKAGEDGIRVAREIQGERDVPVVFLTAYSDETTVSRAKEVTPYGYIIKPVENRELQIAIEMAIYKFNIERELRETQQLLQTALTCIGSALLFVATDGQVTDINSDAEQVFGPRQDIIGKHWSQVFALELDSSVGSKIYDGIKSNEVVKLAPFIVTGGTRLPRLVDGIIGPMESGAVLIVRELSEINDAVEMLEVPDKLLADLGTERLTPSESSMCQMLIAADAEDQPVDQVVDRIAGMLNQMLRSTDLVSRYGERQLSVSMPYTSVEEGRQIAASVLKALESHEFGGESASFSIGLSYTNPGDQQPFELFRRASWALNVARESGGNRVIQWSDAAERSFGHVAGDAHRQREYHNLVLLWNVMNVVLKGEDKEELADKVCNHLLQSFDLKQVALLEVNGDSISSLGGRIAGESQFGGVADLRLSERDFQDIRALLERGLPHSSHGRVHLFGLSAESVLYIESDGHALAGTDVEFLHTLVSYLAGGFARFRLGSSATEDIRDDEFLYESPQMEGIAESIKLVAPTDATVLIIGESGTGKEKLARAIHGASPRSDHPFIIVDCGAVVGSLIESELFGHVKGAFTGADRNFSGRLKEAEGGTVLLDEVGELPLDVQVKLLRFVQEHEIAAVGSNRYETVNTRVIAATNRDLVALVAEGNFREDLYYRLNVFTIETPPLRERKEDILLLARHYLTVYARRYSKRIDGFTREAEQALMEQRWPGNIRELINVINRAVILCRDSLVSNIHLGLFPEHKEADEPVTHTRKSLETWLSELVDVSLESGNLPPLAQWLEEDLIRTSLAINADVLNRAAQTLGIPESTLRRKVARLKSPADPHRMGLSGPEHSVESMIDRLVEASDQRKLPLLDVVSEALLKELEGRRLNRKEAAALMGVSLPTYRKMVSESP